MKFGDWVDGIRLNAKKYLIYRQFYVSLAGSLLSAFFMWDSQRIDISMLVLVFLTYFSGYAYIKYQKVLFFKTMIFCVLCFSVCCLIILKTYDSYTFFKWLIIIISGFFYDSFFLKIKVRKIPLAKIFYVGLIWASINSWLIFSKMHWDIFLINFLFVSALVLPFDIRDVKHDDIATFPKVIGIMNTKYLACLLLLCSCILCFFFLMPISFLAFFLSTITTCILICFSSSTHSDAYFSFGIESCSCLPIIFHKIIAIFFN